MQMAVNYSSDPKEFRKRDKGTLERLNEEYESITGLNGNDFADKLVIVPANSDLKEGDILPKGYDAPRD